MVPVVQLYARDVPELPFPRGRDVLQIVWCPLIHEDQDQWAALPRLYWRTEAEVIAIGVGGYPGWTQPPDWPDCGCGRRMEHLLSITATEPGGGRWLPRDEQQNGAQVPLCRVVADPAVEDALGHGMDMGDLGGMYFFICPACPGTPWTYRYDC
jgi:hypothetical protein